MSLRDARVNRSVCGGIAFVAMAWPCLTSGAQSTADVGGAERPVRIEVSGGGQIQSRSESHGNARHNSVVAATVALRKGLSESVAVRLTSLFLARNAGDGFSSPTFSYQLDREDRIAALIVSVGGAARIWGDLTIEPSLGAGVAPYVHRDQRTLRATSAGTPTTETLARTAVGWVWAAGIRAQYRALFVEQGVSVIQGADHVISQAGAYFPLTIGWCF